MPEKLVLDPRLDLLFVAPAHTKLLAENESIRVLEFTAKAGDKIPLHQHPEMAVYVIKQGRRRFTALDGEVVESNPCAGCAFLRTGITTHTEEVLEDFQAILVEVKA
ncbi:hypothetical protein JQ616_29975 [Bradyrhizobium tropiciagri]|uniref:hypothetical protein n=1 Tax=Bradyrhizobium tropiciagri TaxID=312253 RepID=UPI001BAB7739|nr:hypothetical protein [Bradyrhizobium tropiciagri]MBR0899199.1 hypothetical protein [Bradyrhizobium tropiciagri]